MNKRIEDELDDLPEMTEEMLAELKQHPVDLHLGAPEVKKIDPNWWIKEYGPKPAGSGIMVLDILIMVMFFVFLGIFILSWIHVFS